MRSPGENGRRDGERRVSDTGTTIIENGKMGWPEERDETARVSSECK